MGAWGTRLTDDDFALDIVSEYLERFDNGEDFKEIRRALEKGYGSSIDDPQEGHLFWLALAKAQWDVGALDDDVIRKVKRIVESDIDTKIWIELDGSHPAKRRNSIQEFFSKIQTPREKPRVRKRKVLRSSPFEEGDVLLFKTSDNEYGVNVVLSAEKETQFATTDLISIDIKSKRKPSLEEVCKANILVEDVKYPLATRREIHVRQCSIYFLRKDKLVYEQIEVIGRLKIKKKPKEISKFGAWTHLVPSFEGAFVRSSSKKISLKKYLGYLPFQEIKIV